jgi:hypothetical protein
MSKEIAMKLLGVLSVIIVLADFLLFIFGRINYKVFWIVMILFAVIAYFGFPYLAKILKKK